MTMNEQEDLGVRYYDLTTHQKINLKVELLTNPSCKAYALSMMMFGPVRIINCFFSGDTSFLTREGLS